VLTFTAANAPITFRVEACDLGGASLSAVVGPLDHPMPNGYDKNWIRLCGAIDGFCVRYGRWPARVRIFPASLAYIRDHLFTPEDYAKIVAKVALVADEAPMIAEDDLGGSYSLGQDGFPSRRPTPRAAEWLDVRPKPHDIKRQAKPWWRFW